jgi:outer membrane protein OmpA-like peptidoglycan-associated protein
MSGRKTAMMAILCLSIATAALAKKDQDNDGVKDRKDVCAGTPVSTKVDKTGCPVDSDGDWVADGLDQCSKTPAGWAVDFEGCPIDSDDDAVPDGADQCAYTQRGARVDAQGCPNDADQDRVLDGLDRCAYTPYGAEIDRYGCPVDSDHDGVADGLDACPGDNPGIPVDQAGCDATPKAEAIFPPGESSVVLAGVTFEPSKVIIAQQSAAQLEQVARYLRDYPEIAVEIRAYTDAPGDAGVNLALSRRRAEIVKAYLEAKGIDAARLKARGMGEVSPIADNGSPEGREKNRRIELVRIEAPVLVAGLSR